ncbi:MAG: GtrA family protein [Alphaproteobacteria bacterium]|nr:GtrA family protein [Alphaproteobacteria bacterium]
MMALIRENLRRPAVRYILVGVTNTTFAWLLMNLTLGPLAMSPAAGMAIVFALTAIFHFIANRQFTFQSKGKWQHDVLRYLILLGVNYLSTTALTQWLTDLSLPLLIITTAATVWSALLGFAGGKFFVFRNASSSL